MPLLGTPLPLLLTVDDSLLATVVATGEYLLLAQAPGLGQMHPWPLPEARSPASLSIGSPGASHLGRMLCVVGL